jgi:hypothetical protein
MRLTKSSLMRAWSAIALLAALAAFGLPATAGAETTIIKNVKFKGSVSAPELVIKGHGFGASAPSPSYPPGPCPGRGTGMLFDTSFGFNDLTRNWNAGEGGPDGLGNCIGIVVMSWSAKKVVAQFGSAYGGGWILESGDNYKVSILSATKEGVVKYKK